MKRYIRTNEELPVDSWEVILFKTSVQIGMENVVLSYTPISQYANISLDEAENIVINALNTLLNAPDVQKDGKRKSYYPRTWSEPSTVAVIPSGLYPCKRELSSGSFYDVIRRINGEVFHFSTDDDEQKQIDLIHKQFEKLVSR